MKYKYRMWLRYRESKSYNDKVEYKIAQRKAVKEYKHAKKQFESKLARDIQTNPKRFLHMLGQSLRLRIVLDHSKIVLDSWCQRRRKCAI